jgi:hypothetical protein
VKVYFDTSALVPLFIAEVFTAPLQTFLSQHTIEPLLTDWAAAEFASALALRQRMKLTTLEESAAVAAAFAAWADPLLTPVPRSDFQRARELTLRPEIAIRAGDALHLAAAERLGAMLATFDRGLIQAARGIGLACALVS